MYMSMYPHLFSGQMTDEVFYGTNYRTPAEISAYEQWKNINKMRKESWERQSAYDLGKVSLEAEKTDAQTDLDSWLAELAYNEGKQSSANAASAAKSLSGYGGRSAPTGGGTYGGLMSGRNTFNLGGALTGGLTAANMAALKKTKQAELDADYAAKQKVADAEKTAADTYASLYGTGSNYQMT